VKKAKAKKPTKPNALKRTKLALIAAQAQLGSLQFTLQSRELAITRANEATAQKQREVESLSETVSQKNAAISLRDARIGEITAERDRILHLVNQFTSVQITTHGTELKIGTAPSAPNLLRSGTVLSVKADAVVNASAQEEKRREDVAQAYRSSIRTGIAKRPLAPAPERNGTSWASSGDTYWRIGESHDTMPPGVYHCGTVEQLRRVLPARDERDGFACDLPRLREPRHRRGDPPLPGDEGEVPQARLPAQARRADVGAAGIGQDHDAATAHQADRRGARRHRCADRPPGRSPRKCLQMLRAVEPERQVVGILEDVDALIERYGESEYLSLLDGEAQVDNVVYVATTNYPERLDARIVDRPSRFDTIRYIGMPSAGARRRTSRQGGGHGGRGDAGVRRGERRATAWRTCANSSSSRAASTCRLAEAKARLDKTRKVKPNSANQPHRSASPENI
jgi:hypothetical protein